VNNSIAKKTKSPLSVTYQAGGADVTLSPDLVKKFLVSGDAENVTAQEVVMFINLCKYQGLNPFIREAYLIKYGSQPATIVTGKAALEKRAMRDARYRGFKAGVAVQKADGTLDYREGCLVLPEEKLVGGWAEVYVDGYETPVKAACSFQEYAGRKKDGTLNSQWKSKPGTMIRKVAKAQALREAFPEELAGLYAAEEFGEVEQQLEPIPQEEVLLVSEESFAEIMEDE